MNGRYLDVGVNSSDEEVVDRINPQGRRRGQLLGLDEVREPLSQGRAKVKELGDGFRSRRLRQHPHHPFRDRIRMGSVSNIALGSRSRKVKVAGPLSLVARPLSLTSQR